MATAKNQPPTTTVWMEFPWGRVSVLQPLPGGFHRACTVVNGDIIDAPAAIQKLVDDATKPKATAPKPTTTPAATPGG